jgi:hypothetical protein
MVTASHIAALPALFGQKGLEMPKDEFGYDYLRRRDGGILIMAAWACAAASIICAAIGVFTSSFDAMALSGALGSFWAVFFITGYVSRAIYFVAGDVEKPRSRSEKGTRWRSEEGYNRVEI